MTSASGWVQFSGKQTVKCECGKAFGEVAPNATVKVRIRPPLRAVGERHLTHRCRECRRELDMLITAA